MCDRNSLMNNKFELSKINFRIEENESEIKIKKWNETIPHVIAEYVVQKDNLIMSEALKRLPDETLLKAKRQIEQELKERGVKL